MLAAQRALDDLLCAVVQVTVPQENATSAGVSLSGWLLCPSPS